MNRKGLNFDEGKLIAECVEAAESTVPASQRLRHIHAVFSDNVDINEQLTLNVTRNRDAKDIASRTVTAKQEGMSIAYCNLLFKEATACFKDPPEMIILTLRSTQLNRLIETRFRYQHIV
ncbi:hypothetical protein WR25_12893 [Diploscapter pachys]|uniref:Acyl-CoA thioesterase-like N-terminal HotDog domain-containing protein n=1 Tax=Diploscapter pachys TaxID=2018661 RepID=A0A2A2LFD1_9BILA|nr:hypothetical protein WR25_12893 [Diploscapter pachys]